MFHGKTLGELSTQEMRQLIDSLGPKREMHAGIKLLHLILEEKGVEGVIAFVEKGHKILDEEGKILAYDFPGGLEDERLLKRSRPNILDRRTFLQTAGWGISGFVGLILSSTDMGDEVWSQLKGSPITRDTSPPRNWLHRIHRWTEERLLTPAEFIISAALLNESAEKWKEIKLEEVSNAVAEAAAFLDKRKGLSR